MNLNEKTLSSETLFEGKIVTLKRDVVELSNGNQSMREVVEHIGGVCIVALDDEQNIYLVKQFRYPYKTQLLELPAGKKEKGEAPELTASRELKEELGFTAKELVEIAQVYPTVAYVNEVIHVYRATGLTQEEQCLDEDEFLEIVKLPLKQAYDMVMNGEINDSKTMVGVMKTYITEVLEK